VPCPFFQSLGHRFRRWKVHIRHPQGDNVIFAEYRFAGVKFYGTGVFPLNRLVKGLRHKWLSARMVS
jgi:hypothetical protein